MSEWCLNFEMQKKYKNTSIPQWRLGNMSYKSTYYLACLRGVFSEKNTMKFFISYICHIRLLAYFL